ncbi:DNA-directed RNA polymerase I subunit RPA34.5-domain-containing protein [Lophiotrema nucula]|uniref:DNA-directed RNA polymerase I subunit RPA34.5-domain-containing protein n=1 Tax=Lophiotrema nucula TaxID=690887 RepID=A0A6A5ZSE4_9PLEO|nr:DNA-directed RNA polymerase I subunit RPA34.5-domain-containing protein [Lophiotrema nucula]
MSKLTKMTPVPPPASKAKSQLANILQRAQLSKEFVDSDDDSSKEADTVARKKDKPANPKKQKTTIGVHKPQTNGITKKPSKQTPIPPPPAAMKPALEIRETSSSDSDESDDDAAKGAEKHADQETRAWSQDAASESRSSSDSTSDSSSDDEAAPARTPASRTEPQRPTEAHTVQSRPVQPYDPPKGFVAVPTPLNTTSPAARLFSNTEGKQIWHITAPAGVPVKEMMELAMDQALQGGAVLKHNGIAYGLSAEENEGAVRGVLLPGPKGLRPAENHISRTLHLRQVVRLPHLSAEQADPNTGSEAAASITQSAIRAPRKQLKGLRMHFHPSGFGDEDGGTLGSSDSGDEAAPLRPTAGLGVPNGAQSLKKLEKRKHQHTNDEDRAESPVKKHKKHRTPEEKAARAGTATEKYKKHRTPEEKEARAAKKERKRQKELARLNQ